MDALDGDGDKLSKLIGSEHQILVDGNDALDESSAENYSHSADHREDVIDVEKRRLLRKSVPILSAGQEIEEESEQVEICPRYARDQEDR